MSTTIQMRDLQREGAKALEGLEPFDFAEVVNGKGELLFYVTFKNEESRLMKRLNEVEAIVSDPSYGLRSKTQTDPSGGVFADLRAKFDARNQPHQIDSIYPACDKCSRPSEDLKPHFEEGQEYRVCPSCLKPKKK